MPWVTINMLEGRTDDQKRRLHHEVAKAVATVLAIPADKVRIQMIDMPFVNHSVGGVPSDELLGKK